MSTTSKSLAFGLAFVAIVVAPICIGSTEAQKTAANSFKQQFGSNQNSAYGGYGQTSPAQRQRESSFVAPTNQQRRTQQSSYSRTESGRQPAYQPQQQQQQQQQEYSSSSSSSSYDQAEADAEPASYGSVAGAPGVDFPNYTRVPKTSFSCEGLPYELGMYADEETGCQAFHYCYNGRRDSFLCGPGTVFNQRILHCDYWYSVDCGKSSQYYSSNAYMGSSQPEPGPAQASGGQNSYQKPQVASSSSNRPTSYQRPQQQQQQQFNYNNQQQQVQENY